MFGNYFPFTAYRLPLSPEFWLLDVGCETPSQTFHLTSHITHRTSHIYEAEQLRATEPFQKGEMERSFSIMGGITSRIKSISSSAL